MASKIVKIDLEKINAVASPLRTIPIQKKILLLPDELPVALGLPPHILESFFSFKVSSKELFIVSNSGFYKYQEKSSKITQTSKNKTIFPDFKPNFKEICIGSNKVYILYDKLIEVFSIAPWKLLYDIKTNSVLFNIYLGENHVFATSKEKIYIVHEGFLIEWMDYSENIIGIIPNKENKNIITIQHDYYVAIYDIHRLDYSFTLENKEKITSVFYLNEDLLMVYTKDCRVIRVYQWKIGIEPVYEITVEEGLDLYAADEVIYLYGKENGFVYVVFYQRTSKSLMYCSVDLQTPIQSIEFVHHFNTLSKNFWDGNGFIEIVVGCKDFIGICNMKIDFSKEFGVFYTQFSDLSTLASKPHCPDSVFSGIYERINQQKIFKAFSHSLSLVLCAPPSSSIELKINILQSSLLKSIQSLQVLLQQTMTSLK